MRTPSWSTTRSRTPVRSTKRDSAFQATTMITSSSRDKTRKEKTRFLELRRWKKTRFWREAFRWSVTTRRPKTWRPIVALPTRWWISVSHAKRSDTSWTNRVTSPSHQHLHFRRFHRLSHFRRIQFRRQIRLSMERRCHSWRDRFLFRRRNRMLSSLRNLYQAPTTPTSSLFTSVRTIRFREIWLLRTVGSVSVAARRSSLSSRQPTIRPTVIRLFRLPRSA